MPLQYLADCLPLHQHPINLIPIKNDVHYHHHRRRAIIHRLASPVPRLIINLRCSLAPLSSCPGGREDIDSKNMSSASPAYPPYQSHRDSQPFDPNTPPAPPPKPSSQEVSRRNTPAGSQPWPPPPPPNQGAFGSYGAGAEDPQLSQQARISYAQHIQDPGEQWLPKILEDKSYVTLPALSRNANSLFPRKQDLADVLAKPELLAALAHSTSTAHPSIAAAQEPLQAALKENIALASHLNELETRVTHLRSSTQAQLLSTHALERQWKQKQSEMDRALAPFAPSSLYQRLSQGVQEQEMVCRALEESFLEGEGGVAPEREVAEWVRRYREAKKVYYSRRERKERWDEGRVGGWR